MPRRPDAELVKTSKFHEMEFYIMKRKVDSSIYFKTQIDLTHTFEFLEEYNKNRKDKEKLTLFQIYLTAAVRTFALRPKINRFVAGRRLWQRNQITFAFVVKKEKTEEGEEINAMIEFDPFETLETVQKIVTAELYEARHGVNKNEQDVKFWGAMPRFLIRFIFWFMKWTDDLNMPIYSLTKEMPMWASVFLAHLGSINIPAVYHHLFELGTTSLLITIGKIRKAPIINEETDKIEIREVMELKINIDDRIAPGSYTGPTIDFFKNLIENPESLIEPPELTDEQLDRLKLKKYKEERKVREKQRRKEERKK
ncbi:MAG: 2-oxo acid dehydrogenase subunit E2 [Candidatus Heimdallarchaeota archaeon]|nr:2-oxo acid dehydrogenase subunit E2 [Candidatus Heimdallarchaeota archaeon]MCK4878398.1 2-oxo acid dehydrogenase subunit E2 [Candidatus Heimdallarchaeota archaeon]